jgi:hypothetical protein
LINLTESQEFASGERVFTERLLENWTLLGETLERE